MKDITANYLVGLYLEENPETDLEKVCEMYRT